MAGAPVLLAGDIDRGGVFAQLIGTVMLLEEDERAMVKGLIVNKFRGDKTILDPGIRMLEERCAIPVLGVTPYLHIEVDDEDSLTERFDRESGGAAPALDIAVIRLPRISNFTDFAPFERIDGVRLRYVSSVRELGAPDLIFLPGTKNTMGDLTWLRANGLEAAILKAHAGGTPVFGICGGYQMLGRTLSDPEGVEEGGQMRGLGLLDMDTVFAAQKTRRQVLGKVLPNDGFAAALSGAELEGYEIHMGVTTLGPLARPLLELDGERADGAQQENVCGSYVHGLFDRGAMAEGLLGILAQRKGLDAGALHSADTAAFLETQYDLLAEQMRQHLNMEKIYEIMGLR